MIASNVVAVLSYDPRIFTFSSTAQVFRNPVISLHFNVSSILWLYIFDKIFLPCYFLDSVIN